jgi:hypothetical protein
MAEKTSKTSMKVLYKVPTYSSAPNDGVAFWNFVRFEIIPRGACYRSGIRFKGVVAQRRRAEGCSTLWHREASDKLIEIENSDWLQEIYADTRESFREYWKQKHHYMIGLRNAGTLEVIAESWELMAAEEGGWPEIELE